MSQMVLRLLAVTCLSATGALGWQWVDQNGHLRPVVWSTPEPLLPSIDQVLPSQLGPRHPGSEQLAVLDRRPLFSPSRRPPPPKLPPPPPPPPDPLDFTTISGLLTGDQGMVLATVQGQARRLKLGSKVGGWELKGVTEVGAQFAKGGQTREVTITRAVLGAAAALKNAPAAPAPVAAPTGAGRSTASSSANSVEARQQARLETLRRRNELRAQRGLPPLPE